MSEFIRKSEKLASAIYLITSFFDDQEPIKWKLRSLGSKLIFLSILIKDNLFKEKETSILEIGNLISEMRSLLSVARNVGMISPANDDLMQGEFAKYVDAIGHPTNIADFLSVEFQQSRIKEISGSPIIKDKSRYELLDKPPKKFGVVSVKKSSRQSIIVAILKRKKEVMIKDISPLISGCSEKTIQRELLAMVQAGILKKIGEKRWSRYSLA